MYRRKLSAGLVVGAMALVGLGVSGGVAHAAPPTLPGPSVFTLPLPVPLAVTVATGPGGAITDVSVGAPVDPLAPVVVDPAAPAAPVVDPAITVSKARAGRVVFTTDADGVKVSIRSKGQSQSLTARADSIDAFLNPDGGSWAGEVFPGVQGVVPYIIGGTADAPTITVDKSGIKGGGTAADPVTKVDDDGEEISVRVVVTFTSPDGLQTRDLSIRLKVENESDDDDDDDSSDGHASLSITLGKIRGAVGKAVAGPQNWGAVLCDESAGTITYDVAALVGTISNVHAFVDGTEVVDARINVEGNKADVRFPTGERIRIRVSVDAAGLLTINVSEKIRCRDAEAPTVNGEVVPVTDDSVDDDHGDDHGGDNQGGRHGGGDQGGDNEGGGHGGDDKKSDD